MQEIQERPYGATDETTVLEVYVALGTSQTCRGCRGNWKRRPKGRSCIS